MDVYEAIYGRQSVRSFDSSRDVPDELVRKLLEAGCQAPSAGNLQPWRFLVVRDPAVREALEGVAGRQRFVGAAPVVIAVCVDLDTAAAGYGSRGTDLYCLQDAAAAIENILLAAHAEGLGACWVGAFNEAGATRVLNLPDRLRPVALIPLGYPAYVGRKHPRLDLDRVTEWR